MSGRDSLDRAYFDGIFQGTDDAWGLATSPYEDAKFGRTIAALSDRRYARALEIGCAHGVLTRRLAPLCDALLAVDISSAAIAQARDRLAGTATITLQTLAFPVETPDAGGYDLVVLSEVVYYWSDADIARAAAWLRAGVAPGGRAILVHYTGETDYPQTGDDATAKLWTDLASDFEIETAERDERYRLDLWQRR